MLFSILIANYNNGHFFKDCYASIITQTYRNWEVIIVDDCSTDDSVDVIRKIIGNDNRFKLFRNYKNKGCGYTKNKSAQLANGEVLGFLDPDDTLVPEALEKMIQIHSKATDIAIVTSKYEKVDLYMNYIEDGNHGETIPLDKSYLTFGKGAMTHFASFKKRKFDLTDGIDEEMKRAVDQDLYLKLEEVGSVVFLNQILYRYRIHENSISANHNLYKARYWYFYAILKANKRRIKQQMEVDFFSKKEIKLSASNYYMSRYARIKSSDKTIAKIYFLCKSIRVFPTHNLIVKIKKIILVLFHKI